MTEARRPRRCIFIRETGEQCKMRGNLNPKNALCIWHDPTRSEEAARMRERAAEATNNKRPVTVRVVSENEIPPLPRSLDDIADWLGWITAAVITGKVDARTAREATMACDRLRMALRDRDDLDRRLKEAHQKLEAAMKRQGGRR